MIRHQMTMVEEMTIMEEEMMMTIMEEEMAVAKI
jgi:hypothetical protein